ncbi:MAG: protein-L-isoaspartate O-methyltransferase [Magnetococcales bacterium]|nr:protein-L-isoaspartate O-methyltransferase [Magnetococcales bacterium]
MDFSLARTNMVKSQITPNGVNDPPLLDALLAIPREAFVIATHKEFAYSDYALPVSATRRSLKPLQIARLIQALTVNDGQKILVVGAGSGYEATLLARLGAEVYALESDKGLVELGQRLGDGSIEWQLGALGSGWSERAPFDGILLCGAVESVPEALLAQLAPQGRLVAIVGKPADVVMYALHVQGGKEQKTTRLFETVAFPLLAEESAAAFCL